MLTKKNICSV